MRVLLVSKWIDGAVKGEFHHSGEWVETFNLACTFADLGNEVAILTPLIYPKHVKDFEKEFGKILKIKKIKHFVAPIFLNLGINEGVFQFKMHQALLASVKEFKPSVIQFMQLTPTFIHFFTKVPIFFWGISIPFNYPQLTEDTKTRLKDLGCERNLIDYFVNLLYFGFIKILGIDNFAKLARIGTLILKHKDGYQRLKQKTQHAEKIFFIHKGTSFKKAIKSKLNNQTVLFIGSITYRKGIFDLVSVFVQVSKNFPKAKLLIAGTGPKRLVSKLTKEIKKTHANVKLLGPISYLEKWKLYQKADIFCLPSYADASPAVIMEAMAAGLPIITTYQADPPIKNGKNGILINAGDINALYASIEKLLLNPILADKLGTSVRETAKLYSWEYQAKKLLRLYRIKINQ